jgi:hypothetical protein
MYSTLPPAILSGLVIKRENAAIAAASAAERRARPSSLTARPHCFPLLRASPAQRARRLPLGSWQRWGGCLRLARAAPIDILLNDPKHIWNRFFIMPKLDAR